MVVQVHESNLQLDGFQEPSKTMAAAEPVDLVGHDVVLVVVEQKLVAGKLALDNVEQWVPEHDVGPVGLVESAEVGLELDVVAVLVELAGQQMRWEGGTIVEESAVESRLGWIQAEQRLASETELVQPSEEGYEPVSP